MPAPELRNVFDNELRRVLIQNHRNFSGWYSTLGAHARQVVDNLLEEDITPELIAFAREAPEEEWNAFQFLMMIAGSEPSPTDAVALTNFALGDILLEVREFRKIGK